MGAVTQASYTVKNLEDALRIEAFLEKLYPGYMWIVSKDDIKHGLCRIYLPQMMGNVLKPYMFTIGIDEFTDDNTTRKLLRNAGGEMLERAGLDRHRYQADIATHVDGVAEGHIIGH
jgi:hypothetical protein